MGLWGSPGLSANAWCLRWFAAQVIACERDLKFDGDKVNVRGGGISIGHPIGMSGARILLSLAYAMRARGASLGLATLCISGGQGLAVVIERVEEGGP